MAINNSYPIYTVKILKKKLKIIRTETQERKKEIDTIYLLQHHDKENYQHI